MSGFVLKVSGGSSLTLREYRCPTHGVFEELVPRDTGDTFPCPTCALAAERVFSAPAVHTQFVVSASGGRRDAKPHKFAMDTRPLAEGQSYTEWRKERHALFEEQRHKRVKELLS